MSQNTDHYQLATPTSASPSNNNSKRLLSHQRFLPTSSDFNTPSSLVSTTRSDSPSPPFHTNHYNDKYAFTLDISSPVAKTKNDRNIKSQFYTFDMDTNDEQNLHSPFELGNVPLCENQSLKKIQNDFLIDRMLKDENNRSSNQSSFTNVLNHTSPLMTPSSDHHDIDALSDAGTYIIEDDLDIARDDEPEQDIEQQNEIEENNSSPTSSPFKRYATTKKNRHGTFEIHAISSPTSSTTTTTSTTAHTVNRPIVDLNIPTHDLSSPSSSSSSSSANLSSSSSLLSLPTESDNSVRKEPEGASHYTIDTKSSNGVIYARQRPNTLLPQRPITPPQNQIKPAECFVISPTFETKPFPNTGPRRKLDIQSKPKLPTSIIPTKDTHFEIPSKKSPASPPLSVRSNQSETERFSFRLRQLPTRQDPKPQQPRQQDLKQQQIPTSTLKTSHPNSEHPSSQSKTAVRPHTTSSNDHSYSSPFQRNATIRQTMPANTQYNRPMSSSTTSTTSAASKYLDDTEEILSTHPSLTKVYMNKSFALRRQRSNLVPTTTTTKPSQQQQQQQQQHQQQQLQQQMISKTLPTRQLIKPAATSVLLTNNSNGQTNRAVELRRARAQAKIEELAQRTRQQLQKTEQHNDIMSASWHSHASNTSKKDLFNLRSNPRTNNTITTTTAAVATNNNNHLSSQRQDLLKTRTISSSSHHRSSSASPNPLGETATTASTIKTSRYRKGMTSSVTDESQYQRMHGSTFSEGERCDSLRDDGQRLAIKLIQLSSGILSKLKPNNTTDDSDSNIRELEQLVDQLQTVNRTLSRIVVLLFKKCCDSSVDIILTSTKSSIGKIDEKNFERNYEDSLIAWAVDGQYSNNEKLKMVNFKERSDLQLIGAQIIFRHGARTPYVLLPSLEEVIYSKEHIESYVPSKWNIKLITKIGDNIVSKEKILSANDIKTDGVDKLKSVADINVRKGQLTAIGEKQLFQLGRLIRSELIDDDNSNNGLLPETYDPTYVYCRSTYMDRTISSARSFLAGLFSSAKTNNQIQANGSFEIEVHHFPDEDMFPNPKIYPILKKCHTVASLYTSLNDNHQLKKARQALLNRIGLTSSHSGIIELYDDIVSRLAHNFSVPEDILKLTEDFEVMSAREFVYRATNIDFNLFIRSTCGPLLYLLRENFNSILKNYLEQKDMNIKKSYHKLFIYSGHDSTLIPLAMAFEIFNMRWPKYGAYIFIKYFISKTDPNETYVTVNFAGELQTLPNCHDYYCPYSTFLKNLENRFDKPKIATHS
ncbi:unnamed protein product [Adineta steineri]|uniref:2-phosphoxylose phosphatase 1 n=1 Tax=Adineta steineri TaxID=433720 RepID=A0A819ESV6_9BILA|nr:unnamed protein product [Adineta steineri]